MWRLFHSDVNSYRTKFSAGSLLTGQTAEVWGCFKPIKNKTFFFFFTETSVLYLSINYSFVIHTRYLTCFLFPRVCSVNMNLCYLFSELLLAATLQTMQTLSRLKYLQSTTYPCSLTQLFFFTSCLN